MRASPGFLLAVLVTAGCLAPRGTEIALAAKASGSPTTQRRLRAAGAPVVPATAQQLLARVARPGADATLVNVWATWCVPCRQEFPALLRTARGLSGSRFRLLLVSADFADQLPEIRRFLAAQGVRDTSYLKAGPDMEFINTLNPAWSGALPATFVYDRRGRLVEFWEGECDTARFGNAIQQALASPSTIKEPSR